MFWRPAVDTMIINGDDHKQCCVQHSQYVVLVFTTKMCSNIYLLNSHTEFGVKPEFICNTRCKHSVN